MRQAIGPASKVGSGLASGPPGDIITEFCTYDIGPYLFERFLRNFLFLAVCGVHERDMSVNECVELQK
jgi:hypothetical protein